MNGQTTISEERLLLNQLHTALDEDDRAGYKLTEALQALKDAKAGKYELRAKPGGEFMETYKVSLATLIAEAEREMLLSGWKTKNTGRTAEAERKAEMQGEMMRTLPAYAELVRQLGDAEAREEVATVAVKLAEKEADRTHAKVGALRAAVGLMTELAKQTTASMQQSNLNAEFAHQQAIEERRAQLEVQRRQNVDHWFTACMAVEEARARRNVASSAPVNDPTVADNV